MQKRHIAAGLAALGAFTPLHALADGLNLDCRSISSCTAMIGCDSDVGEVLHVREPNAGAVQFYWEETAIFSAETLRNGPVVTLMAQGANAKVKDGTSVQTLVLTGGPEAVFMIANYTEGLGFLWSRHQMLCDPVKAGA